MRKLAGLAGVIALAAAVGACSSSGGSTSSSTSASSSTSTTPTAAPKSGTETITGTLTGAPAVTFINSNGNTPPSFPALVFTGPVNTTIKGPISLGSSTAKTATHTFVTPVGKLVLRRTVETSDTKPSRTSKSGDTCYFTLKSTGVYTVVGSQSTGEFAGATGSGNYVNMVVIAGNLTTGKTTCTVDNVGNVIAPGTSIMFKASGPLTVKGGTP